MKPDAILAERSSSTVRPHFVAQVPDYPTNLLSDRQFEILVYELLKAEEVSAEHYDSVSLLSYGADKGRDIVLYHNGTLSGVVQCKRYASSLGLNNFIAEVCKLIMFSLRDERVLGQATAVPYELWTSGGVTEDLRSFIAEANHEDRAASLIPAAVEKVRKAYKSLAAPPEGLSAEQENQTVTEVFSRLDLKHIGGVDLNQRLRNQPQVASWFFRGPDSAPKRATNDDIDCLVEKLRLQQLSAFAAAGRLGNAPYVNRKSISTAFNQFLEVGAKAMVLVGGSGFGKTTLLARLLDQELLANPVTLILCDDISEADDSAVSTLSRQLRSGRLSSIPSQELDQAVWEWIDSANRLILIDGLDRVPSRARQRLHRWLIRTIDLCDSAPVRFLITTRLETWSLLLPELDAIKSKLFEPEERSETTSALNSVQIDFLSWDEARQLYTAYGMDIEQHGRNYLRTPSMIANASRMADSEVGTGLPPTRLSILKARVDEAVRDVGQRSGIGRATANRSLGALGRLIAETEDGRVKLLDLPDTSTAEIMDEFAKSDLLRVHDDIVRPEMDDILEYLWASSSNFEALLESCSSADSNPLKIGALALSVAMIEKNNKDSGRDAVRRLVERSDNSAALFEAAARAVAECADATAIKEEIQALVSQWRRPNLFLPTSNFGQLVKYIRLPALDHLEVILPLAENEDLDDWRIKYWYGDRLGRFITAFGHSTEELIRRCGPEVLGLLSAEMDRGEKRAAVAEFLLFQAFISLPPNQLVPLWDLPDQRRTHVLRELTELSPEKVGKALGAHLRESPLPTDEKVLQLFHAARTVYERDPRNEILNQLAQYATRFLDNVAHPTLRTKLALCILMQEPTPLLQKEVFEAYDEIDPDDLWLAIGLMGSYRKKAIGRVFDDNGVHNRHGKALAYLEGRSIPVRLWPYFNDLIVTSLATMSARSGRNAALALETLLYSTQNVEHLNKIKPAAMAMARSPYADVRRPMTYFAGTPREIAQSESLVEFKNELLWELVRSEDGSNLQVVGWKILQSARERADAASQLRFLFDKFEQEEVMERIGPYDQIEVNTSWLLKKVQST